MASPQGKITIQKSYLPSPSSPSNRYKYQDPLHTPFVHPSCTEKETQTTSWYHTNNHKVLYSYVDNEASVTTSTPRNNTSPRIAKSSSSPKYSPVKQYSPKATTMGSNKPNNNNTEWLPPSLRVHHTPQTPPEKEERMLLSQGSPTILADKIQYYSHH